jgi:DNA-binding transcriptional ArsR family regulator
MGASGSPADESRYSSLARAMAHPLRGRILFAVADKPGATIRQISVRLDEPNRRVRHQLEKLRDEGLVLVTPQKNRRGGVEYRYRATASPILMGGEKGAVTAEQERGVAVQILRTVVADATAAVRAGTFGSHPGHGEVRYWGEVDEAGWEELAEIHLRACEEVKAVFTDARLRSTGQKGTPVTSAMFLFESPVWIVGDPTDQD